MRPPCGYPKSKTTINAPIHRLGNLRLFASVAQWSIFSDTETKNKNTMSRVNSGREKVTRPPTT